RSLRNALDAQPSGQQAAGPPRSRLTAHHLRQGRDPCRDSRHAIASQKGQRQETSMPYIDGFVLAVPTADRQKFIDHAATANAVFIEQGATRVFECWGEDVPEGKQTDFRRAVQAK